MNDNDYLKQALILAKEAEKNGEVPIGAILVLNNTIIGGGKNSPITLNDPTAHAEILALREGAKHLNNYRTLDATLYVTLEPCAMCVGAMVQARIKRLVYGALDPKAGAVDSAFQLLKSKQFNHTIIVDGGVLNEECGVLLSDFFKKKRKCYFFEC